MESAIPPHLSCPRTRQARASADYVPPVPAYCARLDTSVGQVVMAYLGVQYRSAAGRTAAREQLAALRHAAPAPTRPRHDDLAFTIDEAGFETRGMGGVLVGPRGVPAVGVRRGRLVEQR